MTEVSEIARGYVLGGGCVIGIFPYTLDPSKTFVLHLRLSSREEQHICEVISSSDS